jgi:hypothetical protein
MMWKWWWIVWIFFIQVEAVRKVAFQRIKSESQKQLVHLYNSILVRDLEGAKQFLLGSDPITQGKPADPNRAILNDDIGLTAYGWAIHTDFLGLVIFMHTKCGAKVVMESDPNKTPLQLAVQQQAILSATYFLKNGHDPNDPSSSQFPPLQFAVFRGNLQLTQLLLKYGAHWDVAMQNLVEGGGRVNMLGVALIMNHANVFHYIYENYAANMSTLVYYYEEPYVNDQGLGHPHCNHALSILDFSVVFSRKQFFFDMIELEKALVLSRDDDNKSTSKGNVFPSLVLPLIESPDQLYYETSLLHTALFTLSKPYLSTPRLSLLDAQFEFFKTVFYLVEAHTPLDIYEREGFFSQKSAFGRTFRQLAHSLDVPTSVLEWLEWVDENGQYANQMDEELDTASVSSWSMPLPEYNTTTLANVADALYKSFYLEHLLAVVCDCRDQGPANSTSYFTRMGQLMYKKQRSLPLISFPHAIHVGSVYNTLYHYAEFLMPLDMDQLTWDIPKRFELAKKEVYRECEMPFDDEMGLFHDQVVKHLVKVSHQDVSFVLEWSQRLLHLLIEHVQGESLSEMVAQVKRGLITMDPDVLDALDAFMNIRDAFFKGKKAMKTKEKEKLMEWYRKIEDL